MTITNTKTRTNLGADSVRKVYEMLQVDDDWAAWDGDGFSWWAKDYRQRIWAEPGVEDNGETIFKICAVTDFLKEVADDDGLEEKLSVLGKFASTYGQVWDVLDRTVKLWTSYYVHEQNADWAVPLFAQASIVQVVDAQIRTEIMAKLLGGRPETTPHPLHGVRPTPDDMLNVVERVYVPLGERASLWAQTEEFEEAARMISISGAFANGGATGVTSEFPFGEDTAMVTIETRQPHPQLGNGLLVGLNLPIQLPAERANRLAVSLNALETVSFVRSHFVGSWCVTEVGGSFMPVYVAFYPNAFHRPGLVLNLLMGSGLRARWVREEILPDGIDSDIDEILAARLLRWKRRGMLSDDN